MSAKCASHRKSNTVWSRSAEFGIWNLVKKLGYEVSPIEFPNPGAGKPRMRFLRADEEKRLLAEGSALCPFAHHPGAVSAIAGQRPGGEHG